MKFPRHGLARILQGLAFALGLTLSSHGAVAAGPGPEVCANCHKDQAEFYAASVHGQKGNLRGRRMPASAQPATAMRPSM